MKREFVGRGLLVLALGVGGIGSAWAVDWSACAAGDIVALAAGESATVTDADISSVAALGGIDLGTGATITFDISGELVLQGYLKGAGTVIKNGTGLLRYTLLGSQDYKLSDPGETIVNAGILELPSTADTAYNYAAFEFSRMTVNNPGVLRICERGTSYVLGLWGDGTVTNALKTSPYAQFQVRNDTRGLCSVFSGKMTGPALRACYAAYCDFLNPDNDNAGETSFQAGLNVGITKFGNKGEPGSLGKSPYNLRGGNVRFRYLGTGETSTRDLYFSQQSDRFTFDAGTHGDFHWAGHVESYYSANNQKMRTLCLAGSNAVPCTFSGSIVCKELNDGDVQTNLFLRKEGPGRWNMLDKPADATANSVRSFAGNVEVVEGTLGFASIAEKGTACSLGTGLLWQDSYATAYTHAKDVPYAIRVGNPDDASVCGMLEYIGTNRVACASRPIGVAGHGGLSAVSGGSIRWTGLMGARAGENTLTLAGDTHEIDVNAALQVADGAGRLSVEKVGTGRWLLTSADGISGDVRVKAGELLVRGDTSKVTDDFTWFRFIIRGSYAGIDKEDGKYAISEANVQMEELAFYAADGTRINGFTYIKGRDYPEAGSTAATYYFPELTAFPAGSYAMLGPDDRSKVSYGSYGQRDIFGLFDAVNSKNGVMVSYNGVFDPENPKSWLTVQVRMPADAPKVATVDVCALTTPRREGGGGSRALCYWTIQGSRDGVEWYTIKKYDYDPEVHPAGRAWFSDGTTFVQNQTVRCKEGTEEAAGYPAVATDVAEHPVETPLAAVRSVSVAPGAKLTAIGDVTLSRLTVDPAGVGTLTGFAFAETGVLDVTVPPSTESHVAFDGMPGCTGFANVSKWQVLAAGVPTRAFRVVVRDSGLDIYRAGFTLMLR